MAAIPPPASLMRGGSSAGGSKGGYGGRGGSGYNSGGGYGRQPLQASPAPAAQATPVTIGDWTQFT